ncbi:hypothetical protein XENOCAPTIV_006114 [Xenoophorus captivus]|uniref:Uncharacterized protein n=1 Tax=Xenoophorus captivus TaxID=1517983 RepID=A0ABV0S7C7_9TELE
MKKAVDLTGPRVWRTTLDTQHLSCFRSTVRFPQSVLIWAAMSFASVGPICSVRSKLIASSRKCYSISYVLFFFTRHRLVAPMACSIDTEIHEKESQPSIQCIYCNVHFNR